MEWMEMVSQDELNVKVSHKFGWEEECLWDHKAFNLKFNLKFKIWNCGIPDQFWWMRYKFTFSSPYAICCSLIFLLIWAFFFSKFVIGLAWVVTCLLKVPFFYNKKVPFFTFGPKFPSLTGMVLPKCWIGLAWVVAFYGCVAQTQALLSEDELIRWRIIRFVGSFGLCDDMMIDYHTLGLLSFWCKDPSPNLWRSERDIWWRLYIMTSMIVTLIKWLSQ